MGEQHFLLEDWQRSCTNLPTHATKIHPKHENRAPTVPNMSAHMARSGMETYIESWDGNAIGMSWEMQANLQFNGMFSCISRRRIWMYDNFLSYFAFLWYHLWNFWREKKSSFSLFSLLPLSNRPEIISSVPLPHSCSWVLFSCLFLQLQKSNTSLFNYKSTVMGRWRQHICYF